MKKTDSADQLFDAILTLKNREEAMLLLEDLNKIAEAGK